MYQDYLDDIIKFYREGADGRLPQRLINPSPAKCKEECKLVFETRFDRRDLKTLIAFFGTDGEKEAIGKAITRCDRDRFRPLSNYLRNRTDKTDDLNIELLAWLIDFPRRPFRPEDYHNRAIEVEETPEQANHVDDSHATDNAAPQSAPVGELSANGEATFGTAKPMWRKSVLMILGMMLALSVGAYYFLRTYSFFNTNKGVRQCMIWVDDRYIPSTCEPRRGDTAVVAYDAERINNFRRITRPDTITLASENKVWYLKRNGKIEYYTAGGRHPLDHHRVLKPLSRYMIQRYSNSPQE